ncbi:hypothetical protein CCR75_001960 [Bremia lactucae]|uniref:Uncharacterized protein n=1 Tax=Bremia lactucae TaxID=4779 RepID=A0A976FIS9_BRELC|nr:hypothetical protein CCR75_007134 [Bremia lactucae]TDH67716.1 hypothetical protein CCR75_001960 [Bremia lactucae]
MSGGSYLRSSKDGHQSAETQHDKQLLFVQFRATSIAVILCAWDFFADISSSNSAGGALLLIIPQLTLFLVLVSSFFSAYKLSSLKHIFAAAVTIATVSFLATIHSSFRLGISFCCCSRSFCPITGLTADSNACGIVVNNCYMAFIRKIAHFYGTVSLQAPLITIILAALSIITRQMSGRKHCDAFMANTIEYH